MVFWHTHITDRSNQKYPEVFSSPTISQSLKNIHPKEWFYISLWTMATAVGGFVYGRPVRMEAAAMAGFLSLCGGITAAGQSSSYRLRGFKENSRELEKYGIENKKIVSITRLRPLVSKEDILKKA